MLGATISWRFVLRLKLISGVALFPNMCGKSGSSLATSSRFNAAFIAGKASRTAGQYVMMKGTPIVFVRVASVAVCCCKTVSRIVLRSGMLPNECDCDTHVFLVWF